VVEDDAGLVALPGSIRTVIDVLFLSAAYAEETDDVVVARLNGVISEEGTEKVPSWVMLV
jgi:hypothetical protein